jgi:hypothetical protein
LDKRSVPTVPKIRILKRSLKREQKWHYGGIKDGREIDIYISVKNKKQILPILNHIFIGYLKTALNIEYVVSKSSKSITPSLLIIILSSTENTLLGSTH